MATTTATLALVLVLSQGAAWQETAPVPMLAPDCLAAMEAIHKAPMPTVAFDLEGNAIPAIDAYCTATTEDPL